ncbi:hypothetical protein LPJ61_004066 [Coemansia biformis]|uniref:Uncharacterized protein n=1 Tax=Coemansia biformis TaxID=1286918 RepID=A0A9W7Y9D5_9FUNG|nr:hypothetical protein LPJ61_004066 [Coemansia biformis]
MSEYVRGVAMTFNIPEEESLSAAVFPFELIGSYVQEQDIPRYRFELERKVKQDIANFRDDMEMRTIHQMYQRRMQPRRNQQLPQQDFKPQLPESTQPRPAPPPPHMARASSTPICSMSSLPIPTAVARPSAAVVHFDNDNDESGEDGPASPHPATNHHAGYGAPLLRITPDTIKTRLPAIKKPETPKPMSSRIKSLFRSKPRPTSNA